MLAAPANRKKETTESAMPSRVISTTQTLSSDASTMDNMWVSCPDDGQTLEIASYHVHERFFQIRTPIADHDGTSINHMMCPVDFDAIEKIDPGGQDGRSMALWKALYRGFSQSH